MDDDLDLDEPAADVVQRLADETNDTDLPEDLPNGDLSDLHADEPDTGAGDDIATADPRSPHEVAGTFDAMPMMFQIEPSGLKFNPANPAELRISYAATGGDLDNDGDHDSADDSLEARLAIWRQETPGTPFQRLSSLISTSDHDVRANLTGFSRYAVSY